MDDKLREKLEKFDEEMNWAGMSTDDILAITTFALEKLSEYLGEISAPNERATIDEAKELVDTHLTE